MLAWAVSRAAHTEAHGGSLRQHTRTAPTLLEASACWETRRAELLGGFASSPSAVASHRLVHGEKQVK